MAMEDYSKALRLGTKYYRSMMGSGRYPYLQVLDEILAGISVMAENNLGMVEVPIELIAGTKTVGRRSAFAGNFMPLLETKTEFAAKWAILYDSLKEQGLRDPIKAYEFMGHFYVQEGNKRVSVMKSLGAVSITATVTRIIPERTDELWNRIYFEYMDFYKITAINYLMFSSEGGYAKLLEALPYSAEKWTNEDRGDFRSVYATFSKVFLESGGDKLEGTTIADALVRYLEIYDYAVLHEQSAAEMKAAMTKMWKEFVALQPTEEVELLMDPEETKKGIMQSVTGVFENKPKQLLVAFISDKNAKTSSWNYGHELGRRYLEQAFPAKELITKLYDDTKPEEVERRIAQAVNDGSTVIFTTTPLFLKDTLKAALEYPNVKFLNCSLNTNHPSIHTYHARLYEAKFLLGIVAGAMCKEDKVGYIAHSPTASELCNINAFAIGVKMVNPEIKVILDWEGIKDNDPEENLKAQGVRLISGKDWITPESEDRHFGLYELGGSKPNIAVAQLDWGKLYETVCSSILDGSWKVEEANAKKAINYWWGISSGAVDIVCGSAVPASVKQLVKFLRDGIAAGVVNPFSGILMAQNGVVANVENAVMTPDQILKIDWLYENIVGSLPDFMSLGDTDKQVTRLQSVEPLSDNKVKLKAAQMTEKQNEGKA